VDDGDLAELGAGGVRAAQGTVKAKIAAQGRAVVYGQLLGFAYERGRSDGWAAHAYREVFGTWPNRLSKLDRFEPTPLMRSWLRSRDIAFAKSRNAQRERGTAA
jgi:hypothetical protein